MLKLTVKTSSEKQHSRLLRHHPQQQAVKNLHSLNPLQMPVS
jgi:hypothetical protein